MRDLQTLTASDRWWFGDKAGTTRLGFAVLLKMFQADGRFPHRLEEVPLAAVTAIARQVEVPAEAWLSYDWRSRTAVYHRAQIRDALGFREVTLDDVTLSRAGCKARCLPWSIGQTGCWWPRASGAGRSASSHHPPIVSID